MKHHNSCSISLIFVCSMKRLSVGRFFAFVAVAALALFACHRQAQAQNNFQKAQQLFAAKEYPAALPLAQAAAKQNPRDIPSLLLVGDIFDALDQPDSALAYYQKAQEVDYWKAEVMRKVALGLSAAGRHAEALKKAEELTKTHPKDAESFLTLSAVLVGGNETPNFPTNALTQADAAVIKAQTINKELPATYVARGDIYFAQRVYELAKENYEEALKRDSSLLDSRAKLAESYFRLGNLQGTTPEENIKFVNLSLQEWTKITRADTNNAKAFYNKGRIQFLARKYAEAVPTLQRYLVLRPENNQVRWYLAQSAFYLLETEKVEYDTALVQHLEIVSKTIDSVADRANLMIAKTLLYKRNFKAAEDKFGQIKASKGLEPSDIELFARAAINAGDTAIAVREYKDFFEKNPKSCRLMLSIGQALYTWRQYDDAIAIFRKRLDTASCPSDSNDARVYYFIGAAYYSKNRLDSALPALQMSVKLDPKALYARNQLASTYLESKPPKVREAKEELLKVLEAGKADAKSKRDAANAVGTLCRISNSAKNFNDLKNYSQEWTNLEPENPYGWFYAGIAAQNLQDIPSACKYYQETITRMKATPSPNAKMIKDLETQLKALGCGSEAAAPATKGKK